MTAIVVLAKAPRPGAVKTRLSPPLSHYDAAAFAAASLSDTLDVADQVAWSARILALDVHTRAWARPGWLRLQQRGESLDERLGNALLDAQQVASGEPVLLIGMDTPHLTAADLRRARDALTTHDAVVGPATDGGFWALGLRRAEGRLVHGVQMSTAATAAAQLERLSEASLRTALVAQYRDIDTIDDAWAAARSKTGARFALHLHFAFQEAEAR